MAEQIFYPGNIADTWENDVDVDEVGTFYEESSELYLGSQIGINEQDGVRFVGVTVPQGAIITNCFVRFKCLDYNGNPDVFSRIGLENADDATVPASSAEVAALIANNLTGVIRWDIADNWTNGLKYDTPDLSSILQTIISRGDWASGNSIQVVVIGDETPIPEDYFDRIVHGYNPTPGYSPELHIEYEIPSPEVVSIPTAHLILTGYNPSTSGGNIPEPIVPPLEITSLTGQAAIGISTKIYDLRGARYFRQAELDHKKSNENYRWARRASRTKTLDGGVAVYDTGYAPGDRDIIVKVPGASPAIADFMAYLVETYNEIVVSTSESVFLGVPATFYIDGDGAANLIINVKEDIGG